MSVRRGWAVAGALCLASFAWLSLAVTGGDSALGWEVGPAARFEQFGWWLREGSGREALMRFAERLGTPGALGLAVVVSLVVAAQKRSVWLAGGAVALAGSAASVTVVLKPLVGRVIGEGRVLAFPSGHSSGSIAIAALAAGCVAVLWSGRARMWGWAVCGVLGAAGAVAPPVVGFHYLTDSVGSVLWLGAVGCAWWSLRPEHSTTPAPAGVVGLEEPVGALR